MRERSVVKFSVTPSTKCSWPRVAADVGEWQDDDRQALREGFFRRWGGRGFRLAGCAVRRAACELINPHRTRDVLERLFAEIDKCRVDPAADVFVGGA